MNSVSALASTASDNTADTLKTSYATGVLKAQLNQQQQDGQNAVALIDSASSSTPPPPSEGKGGHVNTYA